LRKTFVSIKGENEKMRIFEYIFAPNGAYPPAGMFSTEHNIAVLLCILFIGVSSFLLRTLDSRGLISFFKISAPIVTLLEFVRIGHSFYHGYTWLDSWMPLGYCSLFIYALWMAGYGKGAVRKCGLAFLSCGIIPGAFFVLMPSTSLTSYPIFHFLSVHSLLYHSAMALCGIVMIGKSISPIGKKGKKGYACYAVFFIIFAVISVILNCIYNCNMMFLREPYNIPIPLLRVIQEKAQPLYTAIIACVYLIFPYLFTLWIYRITERLTFRKEEKK